MDRGVGCAHDGTRNPDQFFTGVFRVQKKKKKNYIQIGLHEASKRQHCKHAQDST